MQPLRRRKPKYTDIPELLDRDGNYDNPDDEGRVDSEEESDEEDE